MNSEYFGTGWHLPTCIANVLHTLKYILKNGWKSASMPSLCNAPTSSLSWFKKEGYWQALTTFRILLKKKQKNPLTILKLSHQGSTRYSAIKGTHLFSSRSFKNDFWLCSSFSIKTNTAPAFVCCHRGNAPGPFFLHAFVFICGHLWASCSGRLQVQLTCDKTRDWQRSNWKMPEVGSTDQLCGTDRQTRLHLGRCTAASWDPTGLSSARLVDKGRVHLKVLSAVTNAA